MSPKIIGLTTAKTIELVYDESGDLVVTDAMYVFRPRDGRDVHAMMAAMQSKLFLFLYRVSNQGEARVIPQVKAAKLQHLPFPELSAANAKQLATLCADRLSLSAASLKAATQHEQTAFKRQIDAKEAEIDRAVCAAYGVTRSEIAAIEKFLIGPAREIGLEEMVNKEPSSSEAVS